jgi:hypothetical protein
MANHMKASQKIPCVTGTCLAQTCVWHRLVFGTDLCLAQGVLGLAQGVFGLAQGVFGLCLVQGVFGTGCVWHRLVFGTGCSVWHRVCLAQACVEHRLVFGTGCVRFGTGCVWHRVCLAQACIWHRVCLVPVWQRMNLAQGVFGTGLVLAQGLFGSARGVFNFCPIRIDANTRSFT